MEEEEEGGIGFIRSWKKDIKFSKYISDVLQKHRLLDRKIHGTSPDRRRKRNLAMARFIEKHRNNTGQIVSDEGEHWPTFCDKSEVITQIVFGRPIIKSFTNILSKYHSKKYGGVLGSVLLDVDSSSFGQITNGDCRGFAKWIHLNYTAKHKNDDGYSEKLYFAEVVLFKFRFAGPLFCIVHKCLPAEHDGSGTCQCLLPKCDPRIQHPSQNAYLEASLSPVSSYSLLWNKATRLFHEHFWYVTSTNRNVWLAEPSWPYGPIPVDKLINLNRIPYGYFDELIKIDLIRRRGVEAETEYLYLNENILITNMSKHIPVPKKILLSEVKRQSNSEIQKRALAIAECIEERKKPRMRKPCPLFEHLSMELTKFWRETNGDDLEELNGIIINKTICPEHRSFTNASWIHVNFNAKRKNDDDDSGVSENLYFAEVVRISHLFQNSIYKVKVCIPVDKNHPSGKCGMCNEYNICHPSKEGSYIDDTSKMNPSEFSEYMEGPNTFEEALRGRDLAEVCCGP